MNITTPTKKQVSVQVSRTKEFATVATNFPNKVSSSQYDALDSTVEFNFQRNSQVGSRFLFENKILWTIDDLSAFTGLAKQTIYNKINRKEIPYRKCGRRLRFMPDEILNWIEEGDKR